MTDSMVTWWFKPSEKLPADKEQILVRLPAENADNEWTVELAYYDSAHGTFILKNSTRSFRLEDNIEWMETLRSEGL